MLLSKSSPLFLILLARSALSSPYPTEQGEEDSLRSDDVSTTGTSNYDDFATNSTNSTDFEASHNALEALLNSTRYFEPGAKISLKQGQEVIKASYQVEVALRAYINAETVDTLTPEDEFVDFNQTLDDNSTWFGDGNATLGYGNVTIFANETLGYGNVTIFANGTISDGNGTFANGTLSDGNGTYFANGTYIAANGTIYDLWNYTSLYGNDTEFGDGYANYTAEPLFDPCGPTVQDGTVFDTCTVDPDGRPNVNGSALVYYSDYPGAYSVQCLPFPHNGTAGGDNSSFTEAPMRTTQQLNLTACEANYEKFCGSIAETNVSSAPQSQWIWNDWAPGCAMAMWLPGDENPSGEASGRAPYPDTVRCEYGIFRMMALQCGDYTGPDSQIASVNVARFQGNGSTGMQVNSGYPSYIIAPEVLSVSGGLAYDQSKWMDDGTLGGT
ncbi:MAG: hypothetical protein Q9224_003954 [Gallowayella concinna]